MVETGPVICSLLWQLEGAEDGNPSLFILKTAEEETDPPRLLRFDWATGRTGPRTFLQCAGRAMRSCGATVISRFRIRSGKRPGSPATTNWVVAWEGGLPI